MISRIQMDNKTFCSQRDKITQIFNRMQNQHINFQNKIINKGKSDLLIRSVKASCGCTAANPATNVVKPGTSTDLNVLFDSNGKLGMQNKTITIISNDPNSSTTILRISGNVNKAK